MHKCGNRGGGLDLAQHQDATLRLPERIFLLLALPLWVREDRPA